MPPQLHPPDPLHFSMKLTPIRASLAIFATAFLSGCAIHINDDGRGETKPRTTPIASNFQCVQSATGQCHYALYTSRCNTVEGGGGKPATSCNYQVFEEFTVAVGQTRAVRRLPEGYKQCMKPDAMPNVPNCD